MIRVALVLALLLLSSPALAQPVILDGGVIVYTMPDGSEVAVGPNCADRVQDYDGQAGCSAGARFSRGPCNPFSVPLDPGCDRANPGARDLTIAPYFYGYSISYPGQVEMNVDGLSIHANHASCHPQWGCTGSGQLFVGDQYDYGGWWLTAVTPSAGGKGYVLAAADHWDHTSIGDMRLTVRDPGDKVAVWAGAFGGETEVASFDGAGALVCSSVTTGPIMADSLTLPHWRLAEDGDGNAVLVAGSVVVVLGWLDGGAP